MSEAFSSVPVALSFDVQGKGKGKGKGNFGLRAILNSSVDVAPQYVIIE